MRYLIGQIGIHVGASISRPPSVNSVCVTCPDFSTEIGDLRGDR